MRLIITGCEFAGKRTLAARIRTWGGEALGGAQIGFHDHFVFPDAEATEEEREHLMAMPPSLKEKYQRYVVHYHLNPAFFRDNDHCVIGFIYSEAVYAPLYLEYGRPGEYADRDLMAKAWEAELVEVGPDTVLVLVKASPEVIKQRMAASPERKTILKEKDVELVLKRFDELFQESLFLRRKFVLDTSEASADETFAEFLKKMEPHFTTTDRLRLLTHQAMQK